MKLRILTILATLPFLFSGCKKFLDVTPQDIIVPQTYYNTVDDLEHSLAGVYDVLGNNALYGGQMLMNYGLDADDGYCSRVSATTGPMLYDFTSSDPLVTAHWNILYIGIGRANLLLENIDNNPSIAQDTRDRIRGEALFLRAYYYFLLVQTYGEVPIVLSSTKSTSNTDIAKSSIKEVYDVILKDMEYAEAHVKDITDIGHGGRVNKSGVRGILARVCLFMAGYPLKDTSKYEDAKNWAWKVINDTKANHQLNTAYSQVFINYAKDDYDIKESLWEVEFKGGISNGFDETGWNGYVNSQSIKSGNINVSLSFVAATANLYYRYDAVGDRRRDWCIANFNSYDISNSKVFSNSTTYASLFARPACKFRREYELGTKEPYATPQNFPVLRYSDVLLMYAEALSEISFGNKDEAVKYLEMVRERAYVKKGALKSITVNNRGSNYTSVPTITVTGGGGTGAKAYATLNSSKQISQILLERDAVTGFIYGEGYTSVPTITISGGGGTGGVATATLFDGTEYKVPATATTDQAALRKFIQEERSRELAFECLRKGDLIRWEKFLDNMQDVYNTISQQVPTATYIDRYRNVNSKHLLWPIPARELSLNSKLTQNSNW